MAASAAGPGAHGILPATTHPSLVTGNLRVGSSTPAPADAVTADAIECYFHVLIALNEAHLIIC